MDAEKLLSQLFRFVAITLMVLAMMLLISVSTFAEDVPMNIKTTRLICLEETDEVGSDEPYLVTLAVNLQTAQVQIASDLFQDIDKGDSVDMSLTTLDAPRVSNVDDIIIMVMMVESDYGGGLVTGSGPFNVDAKFRLEKSVPPLIQKIRPAYIDGRMNRDALIQHLFQQMVQAMKPAEKNDGDDFINIAELRLGHADFSTEKRTTRRQLEIAGDGGRYLVSFEITSGNSFRSINPPSNGYRVPSDPPGKNNSANGSSGGFNWPGGGQGGKNGQGGYGSNQPGNNGGNGFGSTGNGFGGSGNGFGGSGSGFGGSGNSFGGNGGHWSGHGNGWGNQGNGYQSAEACRDGFGQPSNQYPPGASLGNRPPHIQGHWNSNLPGVTYQIRQNGSTFQWSAPTIQEHGQGAVSGAQVQASWYGPHGSSTGNARITAIDPSGRATRIEWSNGVIFSR